MSASYIHGKFLYIFAPLNEISGYALGEGDSAGLKLGSLGAPQLSLKSLSLGALFRRNAISRSVLVLKIGSVRLPWVPEICTLFFGGCSPRLGSPRLMRFLWQTLRTGGGAGFGWSSLSLVAENVLKWPCFVFDLVGPPVCPAPIVSLGVVELGWSC